MTHSDTRQAACKVCFRNTSVPTGNPPFGSHLICSNCHTPLVAVTTHQGGIPLSVSPAILRRHLGFTGRCLIHPFCPWCNQVNYAVVAPAEGRSTPWFARRQPENPHDFLLGTRCLHCEKDFYVEWDQPPLPADCALCRTSLRAGDRSPADPRFCTPCGAKVSQVRRWRKGDQPPGRLRCVLVAGFSRMPIDREVKFVRKRDSEIGEAPIAKVMLSGGLPASQIETAMITVDLIQSNKAHLAGQQVDLAKVTYQLFASLLIVKIWE